MNILSSQIFQYAGTFAILTMGLICFKFSRKSNHALEDKVLLFWIGLDLFLVSISRFVGQIELLEAVMSRSISGLIAVFVLIGFMFDKRKIKLKKV